jgi:hypothetical protein
MEIDIYQVDNYTKRNTAKYVNKNNKTRKNHKIRRERERLARERFRERMNLPIGTSSVGFKGTKEMDDRFNEIKRMFNLE